MYGIYDVLEKIRLFLHLQKLEQIHLFLIHQNFAQ